MHTCFNNPIKTGVNSMQSVLQNMFDFKIPQKIHGDVLLLPNP